ncbi:TPM domain-containing protein [Flavobacteriaceae bacterium TP-CH-4]|uniref:TPM domain-containing protein n=1 Tax=Pelagihabitans pacificus TaxID=2696054 RepID=A0A967AVY6_9FLAO|nr:TPM domain-containing protein [Pelagihabitans pacificus]NHF61409.1 TPM domain-containing protein [Pelagihabitans pacificus]
MRYRKASILLFLLCGLQFGFAQFQIPEKPKVQTSVYDYVDLLPEPQQKALEQKLIRYSDSTSTQIVVAIINSTEGEDIDFLGAQWGQKWGIGQEGKDNGVLILLARGDRRIAISTGYGVEATLTDAMSRRIIQNILIPRFKEDDYYGGLNDGADAIFKVLNGEFKEERTFDNSGGGFPFGALLPIIIFFIILIILSKRNRGNRGGRGGNRSRGLDLWDIIILSNMGRSGGSRGGFGSGGGFGGGGFGGGFGGGGFGGGGASGGW